MQGLERYRLGEWSAPRLPHMNMCQEEMQLAKLINETVEELTVYRECGEIEYVEENITEPFNALMEGIEEIDASESSEEDDDSIGTIPPIQCNECSCFFTGEIWLADCLSLAAVDENTYDEKINKLRKRWTLMESGIDVEYRCVKCRDCTQCKKSEKSEKISLRQEQEMQLVRESISFDLENKRVICTLPVRGEETVFLTSNKDIALRILDQQCKKWFKDTTNKDMILAAFDKLFKTGDTRFMHQLTTEELAAFSKKPVQYFIPWRVVYNDSPTTPVRPVLDGSSGTRKRSDGSGGRCLNDIVVKGKIETLNLVRLALGFSVGLVAVSGDLSQFYYSFKLRPQQWNLQRFLWREGLDPDGPVLEGVIGALIYGVTCVSAQTETAMELLATLVEKDYPAVAVFIRRKRYVDDMSRSARLKEELKKLAQDADIVFKMVGLRCKAWVFSGEDPPDNVTMVGGAVKLAGQRWKPKLDVVEIPIPALHFGKKQRGKLADNTDIFQGTFADLDKFAPKSLTRKQVASKMGSWYDLMGKYSPLLGGVKLDMRRTVQNTKGWTDPMPDFLRSKWLKNFWLFESLRGLQFSRARMPLDAVSDKMRLITVVDAAMDMLMIGVWCGFLRSDDSWSCQHLIGRALLADEDGTIPRNELQALTGGANLSWVVRQALGDWVQSSILCGDSYIALCWTTAESKPLAIFHRNRAIQIRRSVEKQDLYHVRTDANPSDIGTRPEKVTIADVGPGSVWENGVEWMTMDMATALKLGSIKPAASLRLKEEQENEYKKGLTFEKVPELLTRGHQVSERRLNLMEERAEYSKYLILPTKFSFPRVVRLMSIVIGFVSRTRKARRLCGKLLAEGRLTFSVFQACINAGMETNSPDMEMSAAVAEESTNTDEDSRLVVYFAQDLDTNMRDQFYKTQTITQTYIDHTTSKVLCDKFVNQALLYLYRKSTMEIKKFCKNSTIEKLSVEVDGVLLSAGRLLDDMNFKETGELPFLDLGSLGVRVNLPLLERYSPLAYSVADHVHWDLAKHKGVETCNRISLENVCILQGATLFKELADDCVRCKMKRKKYLEAVMGPVSDSQLSLAPPFWMIQVDLFGPMNVFVPGFERNTRNRQVLEAKCWVMTAVCPTTRLVNLQVLESTKAAGWIDGFTRLCCEVGIPSHVYVDQDPAGMSAFNNSELEFRDLQLRLHREKGIAITVCGVAGHDRHGHVERVIRSLQESLSDCGLRKKILHATGLQTLVKLVESQYNNLPLGYHYGRAADNTPLLRILTPNMLRIGRVNKRSLDGPIMLPQGRMELLTKVEETYSAWYKIWLETLVPKLLYVPKWFKSSKELKPGDMVFFRKTESALDGKWVVGMVDQVERGRDGTIRMVTVKYYNGMNTNPEFTLRTVRKLVKLWDIDDVHLADDYAEMKRKFGTLPAEVPEDNSNDVDVALASTEEAENICSFASATPVADDLGVAFAGPNNPSVLQVDGVPVAAEVPQSSAQDPQHLGDLREGNTKQVRCCCCIAHHKLSLHYTGKKFAATPCDTREWVVDSFVPLQDRDKAELVQVDSSLEAIMMAVNVDIGKYV